MTSVADRVAEVCRTWPQRPGTAVLNQWRRGEPVSCIRERDRYDAQLQLEGAGLDALYKVQLRMPDTPGDAIAHFDFWLPYFAAARLHVETLHGELIMVPQPETVAMCVDRLIAEYSGRYVALVLAAWKGSRRATFAMDPFAVPYILAVLQRHGLGPCLLDESDRLQWLVAYPDVRDTYLEHLPHAIGRVRLEAFVD